MPWSHLSPKDQRRRFIDDYLQQSLTVVDLCELYNISGKTAYKWINRFEAEGWDGLEERSSRPLSCPHKTADHIVEALAEARQRFPYWGAKKLLDIVSEAHVDWVLPARSTASDILDRKGLVRKRRRRRQIGHPGKPHTVATGPNELWCADFKGQFKTLDGEYVFPLTVTDSYSRFILECRGLESNHCAQTKTVFIKLFRKYGLPKRIRTDNGVPFATNTLGRLSSLSAWWIRLGILPELIEPGRPDQNGRHERMHKDLKRETTYPPEKNRRAQQVRFDQFRERYNVIRPHESLGGRRPASLYETSTVAMPDQLRPFEYPGHFERRYVSANGAIRWNGGNVPVSTVCYGEHLGLEAIANGIWNVWFGPVKLGRFIEEDMHIVDLYGRKYRHEPVT